MIYPKDYSLTRRTIELNEAFILMPFAPSFNCVHQLIQSVCKKISIKAVRADDLFGSVPIIENILRKINSSEIIIADLTGKNANVFYEVGIAHTLRDRNSIILLAQNLEDIPFDLRHLNIIIYSLEDTSAFRNKLTNTIVTSRLNFNSDEYVKSILSAYNFCSVEIEDLIGFLKKYHQKKYTLFVSVLRFDSERIEAYKEFLDALSSFFMQIVEYQSGIYSKLILTLWNNFLLTDYILKEHPDMISDRLQVSYENPNNKSLKQYEIDLLYYTAVLCIHLCQKGVHCDVAKTWLFNYLKNKRMGRIDTIRTTIERFFVETNNELIDKEIIDNISNRSSTVRESIADICGEKRLLTSVDKLISQLKAEDNPYVVRSIVAALGKMSVVSAAPIIVEWMSNNPDKWGHSNCGSLETIALNAFAGCDIGIDYERQIKAIHTIEFK